MKKIIFVLSIFAFSCVQVSIQTRQSFTQCCKNENIHADTIIRLDGYYSGAASDDNKVVSSFLFFNDGSVALNVHMCNTFTNPKNLYKYRWGTYKIKNDTITTQVIFLFTQSSFCLETKLKILNKESLWEISSRSLGDNSIGINDSSNMPSYIKPYVFNELAQKPDSSCWCKEKRWFWCNEEDWQNYMDNRKRK